MHSLSFSSRADLAQLGLSREDVDVFINFRTEFGEITKDLLDAPQLSQEGQQILERALEDGQEIDRTLSKLQLTLTPVPPIATMDAMTVVVIHHGDIDRELRAFEADFLPHGARKFNVYDISHEHIIQIELLTKSGESSAKRVAIPLLNLEHTGDSDNDLEEPQWRHQPPLGTRESWSPDGSGIFSELSLSTRSHPDVEPMAPEPVFNILREGRFLVPGQPAFRFDSYTFAFGFPDRSLFTKLPRVFGSGEAPFVSSFQADDPVVDQITRFLSLEPGRLEFEGAFGVAANNRPGIEAPGWAWVLSGPTVFAGFQPDGDWYQPKPERLITLPANALTTEGGVPFNVTERAMLENPELFGSDPGLNCRPFDQPGRILGERRFQTALRVSQPWVENARGEPVVFEDVTLRPIDYPRENATETNLIEYEGDDVSLYQAKSVALGHLLETAVRYRSNGYSLGDIAYSLTLAPRQKRRIVKVDFARSERVRRSEVTQASDEVEDALASSRSYDNAVAASLDEWARGRSKSSAASASVGMGFAVPGFVAGGGATASTSSSSSSQEGGRRTAASETQQINDAIRRYGESLRTLQSTVVHEVEQTETVEGVSEVVQNINYTRSLSVIYYEILRHIRVDTEVAGVTECVFVPMPVKPFTDERIRRHKDVLRRYARGRWEQLALQHVQFMPNNLNQTDIPAGQRKDQKLDTLSGSVYIRMGLEMPGEGEIADAISAATDETVEAEVIEQIYRRALGKFTPYLPVPITRIISRTENASPEVRNRFFQRELAPHMARRFVDDLRLQFDSDEHLEADFTLATAYKYGEVLRVDFTVDLEGENVNRASLEKLKFAFTDEFHDQPSDTDDPTRFLPPRSFMDITRAVIHYGNEHYDDSAWSDRGARDLVNSITGHAEEGGALLTFKLNHNDRRDIRKLMIDAYAEFLNRLNSSPFFYHKAIWWHMDRDELYTLLDGFSFAAAEGRSLASLVERRPLGILGNSLVFKVASDRPLDPMFSNYDDLKSYYVTGLPPRDPMRISLPTEGLYARAHMDGCVAAEEHNGSFDWVFNNQEPELADLPASLLESRRATPANVTPTQFPDTIINLQNAPDFPTPSGLSGALGAVQNAGAFRDMAGLAGTQANAQAAMQASAGLANSFGNMALQGAMTQLQADAAAASDLNGMFSAIEKARDSGLITPEQANDATVGIIKRRLQSKDDTEDQHRRDLETKALEGEGGGTVTKTTKDGNETVVKNPAPTKGEKETSKAASKPVGHVVWLDGERGRQDLLLYNFGVGKDDLHDEHKAALRNLSCQIRGVADIAGVEGRASATQTRSEDEERGNEALSQRRMERAWHELMQFALDPQSNMDKQLIFSDEQPIRERYGNALDHIPEGAGDEDPAERSVLIRLARRVQPKIEPIPVPIPSDPDKRRFQNYGHAVQMQTATGDQATLVAQQGLINQYTDMSQKELIQGDQINIGGDLFNIDKIADNILSLSSLISIETLDITFAGSGDPGGTPAKFDASSQKTRQWEISVKNPKVKGSGATEVIKLIEDALTMLKSVNATFPSTGADLSMKLDELINVGVSVSNLNLPNTVGEFAEKGFAVLTNPANSIGKTLAGMVHGDVNLEITLMAKDGDDPQNSTRAAKRTGVLRGSGFRFARSPDVNEEAEVLVAKFDYTSGEAHRLGDWEMSHMSQISIEYWNSSTLPFDFDLLDKIISFLDELKNFLDGFAGDVISRETKSKIDKALHILTMISGMITGGQRLEFRPFNEVDEQVDRLSVGGLLTASSVEGHFEFKD